MEINQQLDFGIWEPKQRLTNHRCNCLFLGKKVVAEWFKINWPNNFTSSLDSLEKAHQNFQEGTIPHIRHIPKGSPLPVGTFQPNPSSHLSSFSHFRWSSASAGPGWQPPWLFGEPCENCLSTKVQLHLQKKRVLQKDWDDSYNNWWYIYPYNKS